MTTIKGFQDNFANFKKDALKKALMSKIPDHLKQEMITNNVDIVVSNDSKTFDFNNCSEELANRIKDAMKGI